MSQELVDKAMNEQHLAHVIMTGKVGPAVAEAIPHLLTAVQCWGEALRSQSQADALVELGKLYQQLDQHAEAIAVFERAVAVYKDLGDKQQVAYVAVLAGLGIQAQGNFELALGYMQRALAINRDGGELTHVARTLMVLAGVHKDMKQYAEALKDYQEALDIFVRFTKRAEIAHTHQQMALTHHLAGDRDAMVKHFELAATSKENVGDVKGQAQILSKYADVERERGDLDAALTLYNRCLSIHKLRNDKALIGQTIGNIGTVHSLRGDNKLAIEHYQQSCELSEEAGERAAMAQARYNIACIHINTGQIEEGLKSLLETLALAEEMQQLNLAERVCSALVEAHRQRKSVTESLTYLRRRADFLEQMGLKLELTAVLDELISMATHDQQWNEASQLQKRALSACRDQGGSEAASRHYHIGTLAMKAGDHAAAVTSFGQALLRFNPLNDRALMATSLRHLGTAELHLGASADARSHLQQSLALCEQLNDKRGQAQALVGIGNACVQLNLEADAKDAFDKSLALHEELGDSKGTATIRKATNFLNP